MLPSNDIPHAQGSLRRHARSGFSLIELMVVVGVIAIIASIALPILPGSRNNANETSAISTLRSISSAQAQFQTNSAIDVDSDGFGEFGYFGEIAGATSLRTSAGLTAPPLAVPFLSATFQNVTNGVVQKAGYFFQVWLPDAQGVGLPEAASGGADPNALPDGDQAELAWCTYAWPVRIDVSGRRAFFANQQGDILNSQNGTTTYSGLANGPAADAAFDPNVAAGSIVGPTVPGSPAKDGEVWAPIQ
jgi:prepilin-type N-terminal cleavage/methylation domain-containing protein